jgi:putative secretion ATPase (PEP-CTERM system associated)
MYEKYFSFKHKPFDLVPNPDFLFLSSTHHKAITYLDYGIKEKIGFILLTGEIGSGKTTLIRNLIKNLSGLFKLSRINNTKVTSEQLIAMINEDFGLDTEGKNKTRLLSELNVFLVEQYSKKVQPVLLIDEAQNLSPDLLEEIRLLSNLETDRAKLLQIILVGQPDLKKTLMLPELMQLRQRINISYHIAPLTVDETEKYIKHRLTIAGNPDAIKFDDGMLPLIYKFSKGIPRLINILCDFALLTAFVDGKKEVQLDIVREIVKDLESKDYWNELQVVTVSESGKIQGTSDLGDIALRLIRLEEKVENNISEIISLSNKIIFFENDIVKSFSTQWKSDMAEVLERVAMLDLTLKRILTEDEDSNLNTGREVKDLRNVAKQIETLTYTVSHLNKKINNQ